MKEGCVQRSPQCQLAKTALVHPPWELLILRKGACLALVMAFCGGQPVPSPSEYLGEHLGIGLPLNRVYLRGTFSLSILCIDVRNEAYCWDLNLSHSCSCTWQLSDILLALLSFLPSLLLQCHGRPQLPKAEASSGPSPVLPEHPKHRTIQLPLCVAEFEVQRNPLT